MRSILNITGAGAVLVGGVALSYSLWPLVLGLLVLVGAAMTIIACATFSKRSTPMRRLRAFVRDLRGDHSSALTGRDESGHEPSRLSGSH
jgi:hypothetical protein